MICLLHKFSVCLYWLWFDYHSQL